MLLQFAGCDSCYLALGVPCLQNLTTVNAHTKDQEGDLSKLSKDGEHGKPRAPSDAQSNIFVLRKMVEEVFTVLYSKKSPKAIVLFIPHHSYPFIIIITHIILTSVKTQHYLFFFW